MAKAQQRVEEERTEKLAAIQVSEGEVAKAQQRIEEERTEKLAAIQVSITFPTMLFSSRLHHTEMRYSTRTSREFTSRKELSDSK